jgi:hypothetical protein
LVDVSGELKEDGLKGIIRYNIYTLSHAIGHIMFKMSAGSSNNRSRLWRDRVQYLWVGSSRKNAGN